MSVWCHSDKSLVPKYQCATCKIHIFGQRWWKSVETSFWCIAPKSKVAEARHPAYKTTRIQEFHREQVTKLFAFFCRLNVTVYKLYVFFLWRILTKRKKKVPDRWPKSSLLQASGGRCFLRRCFHPHAVTSQWTCKNQFKILMTS